MQSIVTAKSKKFDVRWCGASTIDLALRFEVTDSTMQDVLATFTDTKETITLTHVFDERETVYRNYTVFKGVDMKPSGSIVVALMEESA